MATKRSKRRILARLPPIETFDDARAFRERHTARRDKEA